MIKPRLLLIFILIAPLWTSAANAEYLTISQAWVREPPPMAEVMVGYVNVKNISKSAIWLTGIESNTFNSTEIHESFEEKGIARMRYLSFVKIEAGETIEFKPGGKHLMLFKSKKALSLNDKIIFNFKLGNGQKQKFEATVKKP